MDLNWLSFYTSYFQYAHKLAYLIGENVRKDTHVNLNKRLYFL